MSRRSLFGFRRSLFAFVAVCSLAIACSRPGSGGRDPRYPKRKPGCPVTVYHGLPPGPWDDLGVVEVGCYLDEADSICLSRLKSEACYRGGDIIYNVPRKPLRPLERAKVFRAQVAHSIERKTAAEDAPAPADAGTGPVQPLSSGGPIEPIVSVPSGPAAEPTPAPADAGTQ